MRCVSFVTGENIIEITNKAIELEGNFESTFEKKQKILILINALGTHTPESGTTTVPDVIKAVAERLIELNKDVTVCGSSWYGGDTEETYLLLRLNELADEVGFHLVDLKKTDFCIKKVTKPLTFSEMKVTSLAFEYDGVITIPTIKTHSAATISLAMKSLMGFIHDSYKRRFHSHDLSKAIVDLNSFIDLDYVVLDGIYGKIGDETFGGSFKMNCMLCSKDRYALDIVGANLLGYELDDVLHLRYAKDSGLFDFDKDDIEIIGDIKKYYEKSNIPKETKEKFRSLYVIDKDACCPCFASLVYAIGRLTDSEIQKLGDVPIYIGQHVDEADRGIFIGHCNRKFKDQGLFIKGCPTKASDIYREIKEYIDSNK